MGTNAIIAVIAYTGYDMEDAMILNKHSWERGFCQGYVYKSQVLDLDRYRTKGEKLHHRFGCLPSQKITNLDIDGLPRVGGKLTNGDPICSVIDENTGARIKRARK